MASEARIVPHGRRQLGPIPTGVYQTRICSDDSKPEWDRFLVTAPGGHHVQSSRWAQVKSELGWQAARIIVRDSNEILGGAQLLFKSMPLIGRVAYVPKGPVFGREDPALIELVLDHLHRFARDQLIRHTIIQPQSHDPATIAAIERHQFRPSSVEVCPTATVRLDLTQDLEKILGRMKPKLRYNIRLAQRKGISVRPGTKADLTLFHRSLVATSQRQRFLPFPASYFRAMERALSPLGAFQLFVASYRDQPVSVFLVVPFGDTVVYKKGGWLGSHSDRHPNEALHWAVIQWAKSKGYRYYDFDGIDSVAAELAQRGKGLPEALRKSVSGFKLGFGGDVMFLPQPYDRFDSWALRCIYRNLYPRVNNLAVTKKVQEFLRKR
jgi:peptidoglycan pentaglycine glycine transferase (the first glycine)